MKGNKYWKVIGTKVTKATGYKIENIKFRDYL